MVLPAQEICRLAAPAQIEKAVFFPEAVSLAKCPKDLHCCQFVLSPQSLSALRSACLLAFFLLLIKTVISGRCGHAHRLGLLGQQALLCCHP